MRISFGPFAFDPESRLLWREGTEIALPPRVLGVLEALLDRPGQVVARQDLLDRVWKDAFVTDTSLAEAVSFLRQALGDDSQAPRYIQTVHRRGYRFLLTPTPDSRPSISASTAVVAASPAAPPAPAAADWGLVPWTIAILCAALAAAAVWHDASAPAPDLPPVSRFEVRTSPGTAFDRDPAPIAIAPDGRTLAWSACESATGHCAIYVRPVDRLDAQPLAGADDGHAPVFSPDGRWIAFFAGGALKKIATAGGAPTPLASAPDPAGAAWSADGRIVFAGSAAAGLSLVDDQGGTVQALTQPASDRGELRHRHPAWIGSPGGGGSALVFTVASNPDPSAAGSLAIAGPDSPGSRIVRNGVYRATPVGRRYLLLASATDLQAATFDERALVLTGATDSVSAPAGDGVPMFAAGANALAVVKPPAAPQRAWSDGADATPLARFTSIAVSPDSRRAAGVIVDRNVADIWVADLATGTTTRLTFSGANVSPAWSADGQRLFYATRDGAAPYHVVSRPVADTSAPAVSIASPPQSLPTSTAPDGRIALTQYKDGRTAVIVTNADGSAPRVLTDGPYDESAAAFSPDGRWVALESAASGRIEAIVRDAADGRRVGAVSTDGGRLPRWSADGRAIYFTSGRRLMKAPFSADRGAGAGHADAVLDRDGVRAIAIAPSGRMLVERQPATDTAVVVLQWLRELQARLPLPVNTPR